MPAWKRHLPLLSIPSWHIEEDQTGQKKEHAQSADVSFFFLHVIFLNTNPENIWCLLLSTGTGIALSGVKTNSETSRKCSHSNSGYSSLPLMQV